MVSCEMDVPFRKRWNGNRWTRESYSLRMPGMATTIRVTTDPDVFEFSGENHQLFSPGGQLFGAVQAAGSAEAEVAEGEGICWIATPTDGGVPQFLLRTKFGIEKITSLQQLESRLGLIAPGPPPENDPAAATVSRIA
jgi:hypothetical protein